MRTLRLIVGEWIELVDAIIGGLIQTTKQYERKSDYERN